MRVGLDPDGTHPAAVSRREGLLEERMHRRSRILVGLEELTDLHADVASDVEVYGLAAVADQKLPDPFLVVPLLERVQAPQLRDVRRGIASPPPGIAAVGLAALCSDSNKSEQCHSSPHA